MMKFQKYIIKLEVDPSNDGILNVEQTGCPWINPNTAKNHLTNALENFLKTLGDK